MQWSIYPIEHRFNELVIAVQPVNLWIWISIPSMKSFTDDDDVDDVKWMEKIFWVNGQFFFGCRWYVRNVNKGSSSCRHIDEDHQIQFNVQSKRVLYRWFCLYVIFNCYARSSISRQTSDRWKSACANISITVTINNWWSPDRQARFHVTPDNDL